MITRARELCTWTYGKILAPPQKKKKKNCVSKFFKILLVSADKQITRLLEFYKQKPLEIFYFHYSQKLYVGFESSHHLKKWTGRGATKTDINEKKLKRNYDPEKHIYNKGRHEHADEITTLKQNCTHPKITRTKMTTKTRTRKPKTGRQKTKTDNIF